MKKNYIGLYLSIVSAVFVVALGVNAFNGSANTVMENVTIETYNEVDSGEGESLGAVAGPNVMYDMTFHGQVKMKEATRTIAYTGATSSVVLLAKDSGTVHYLSATGTDITDDMSFSFKQNT